MKVGNFHYFILLLFSSPTYKIKLACTLPNQLCFQYFILLSSHQRVHSLFFFFLFYFLIHTRLVTLFSDLNFPSSLSLYVVFLFLLLFSFVFDCASSSTYQLVLHLIWLLSTSHSSFSLSHRGFFVLLYFVCKARLFISFLSSSFFCLFVCLRF